MIKGAPWEKLLDAADKLDTEPVLECEHASNGKSIAGPLAWLLRRIATETAEECYRVKQVGMPDELAILLVASEADFVTALNIAETVLGE